MISLFLATRRPIRSEALAGIRFSARPICALADAQPGSAGGARSVAAFPPPAKNRRRRAAGSVGRNFREYLIIKDFCYRVNSRVIFCRVIFSPGPVSPNGSSLAVTLDLAIGRGFAPARLLIRATGRCLYRTHLSRIPTYIRFLLQSQTFSPRTIRIGAICHTYNM